jgi:alpha-1,3-rhamnosyl/mannosyltransferase
VLTGSEWTKRDLVERYGVPEENILVTPYGFDPVFKPEGPRRDGPPYLLFVGALQERKRPGIALEALQGLDPELHLVFAGPDRGLEEQLRAEATSHGLGDRVEFTGHVSREDLAALYRGARTLVFPSVYEGFGLPVLEAMASGTPVVATRSSSIPEVAGDAAILVEGGAGELAAGIERALADHDRLRAAGLARAALFSWAETARVTAGVYRELV